MTFEIDYFFAFSAVKMPKNRSFPPKNPKKPYFLTFNFPPQPKRSCLQLGTVFIYSAAMPLRNTLRPSPPTSGSSLLSSQPLCGGSLTTNDACPPACPSKRRSQRRLAPAKPCAKPGRPRRSSLSRRSWIAKPDCRSGEAGPRSKHPCTTPLYDPKSR